MSKINNGGSEKGKTYTLNQPNSINLTFDVDVKATKVCVDIGSKCGVSWYPSHLCNLTPTEDSKTPLHYTLTVSSTPTRQNLGCLGKLLQLLSGRPPLQNGGDDLTTTITDGTPPAQSNTQSTGSSYST